MKTLNLNIPAGAMERIAVTGDFLRVNAATAPLLFRFGDRHTVRMGEGDKIRFPDDFGARGQVLTIENKTADIVLATIVTGVGDFDGLPARVSNAPHTLTTNADQTVPATSAALLAAANGSRSELMVQAASTNGSAVRIGDGSVGAAQGLELVAGGTLILNTRAAVSCYNPDAAGAVLRVVEIGVQA